MQAFIKSTFVLVGAAALAASCTLKSAEAPPLTGPSELGTSITINVNPDILPTDGGSQALVTITARDANGQPIRNLSLRTEIFVDGVAADFGTLSARNVVTDTNGRATTIYTAPLVNGGVDSGTFVQIAATPIGGDANASIPRLVSVRLVPVGVVIPPSGLQPSFTNTPLIARDHENITFDASASQSSNLTPIAEYRWSFGDGGQASGPVVNHAFNAPGNYLVTLTIVDTLGRSASTTRTVAISAGTAPSAEFEVSPLNPRPNQTVIFNANGSTAAAGRTIVRYDWTFGDGATDSGVEVSHAFSTPGTYVVVLTVTDDAGRKGTNTATIVVGSSNPTASFVRSPTTPAVGQTVNFNAAASTAGPGRTIVSYQWDFGDGTTGSGQSVSKQGGYSAPGTYTVTLIVTDDQGNKGVRSETITVG
jgi:PKD repeat protein